ncbi:fungal-specific transcription factor domain-containing protein [Boeremia exigua]|uniref:fungal-specific transcription factor domain-containing protein n=1 Tax=Boeremia exigua TaxID=749465 RepID=UPI001E8EC86A|nr:fungal-specific transcription factor domain-containing protein [Boeremia exigua]KAH6618627.1 fungal-specific transcription factor domain-containing protein [Boeremia exigua]
MAETLTVPASGASPHANSVPQPFAKNKAQSQRSKPGDMPKVLDGSGIPKKKQSKSRNGCVTCKAKRLKCDEIKPVCEQCQKRGVTCGGYRKDFKWRPFEEPGCTGKLSRKGTAGTVSTQPKNSDHDLSVHGPYDQYLQAATNFQQAPPPQLLIPDIHGSAHGSSVPHVMSYPFAERTYAPSLLSPFAITPQSISPVESHAPFFPGPDSCYAEGSVRAERSEITAPSSVVAGQSPRLVDLLLPGTDHCAPPEEYMSYRNQHEDFYQPTGYTPPPDIADEEVEEIPRNLDQDSQSWSLRPSISTMSSSSSSSSGSPSHSIPLQPQDGLYSHETISRRFHRDTCGILSVKDGPTENPWRTLVWPLARDCPALYHAIASMTSFHQSSQFPPMRIHGIDHMHTAVQALAEGLQNMRFDAAISTTLVLAFAESWDVHISTGINHIKGAKVLISQALVQHRQVPKQGEEWKRLKFLCNTWIYMDVIARLTSTDDDESNDVDGIYDSIHSSQETEESLDPLMGCARSLFPIIGRVATLIRKLRKSTGDCEDLTLQAIHLKARLEEWTPPSHIESPEDETTSPVDSVKTATAYQYATLLYLHQAFPEIPSLPALALAKRALFEIASVEPSSRSSIIHIYPLMAAGCEMVNEADRAWVVQRWDLLSSRMKLGIIDKSLTVTQEVWSRRDAYAAECNTFDSMRSESDLSTRARKRDLDIYLDSGEDDIYWLGSRPKRRASDESTQHRALISPKFEQMRQRSEVVARDNVELLHPEFTVKGRLHWVGVMRDWNWEVLLG